MKCSTTRIGTQLSRRDAQAKIHRRRKESKICIIYKVECFYVYSFVSDRVNLFKSATDILAHTVYSERARCTILEWFCSVSFALTVYVENFLFHASFESKNRKLASSRSVSHAIKADRSGNWNCCFFVMFSPSTISVYIGLFIGLDGI